MPFLNSPLNIILSWIFISPWLLSFQHFPFTISWCNRTMIKQQQKWESVHYPCLCEDPQTPAASFGLFNVSKCLTRSIVYRWIPCCLWASFTMIYIFAARVKRTCRRVNAHEKVEHKYAAYNHVDLWLRDHFVININLSHTFYKPFLPFRPL